MASFVLWRHTRHGTHLLTGWCRMFPKQQQLVARNICRRLQCFNTEQQCETRRFLSKFVATRARRPPRIELQQELPKHEPPLPIRVALVSATTALATPVFPAIGFVNLFLRVVLPEAKLRATISTSIGSVLSFATWTLIPAFYNVAPAILPCAVGNGVVAGATYGVIDAVSGGPTSRILQRNPLVAGGIGAITGVSKDAFSSSDST